MFERLKRNTARKYSDLIHSASMKYGVWDPPTDTIQVGDYGILNKDDARFQRKGNIYETSPLAERMKDHPPKHTQTSDNVISITSMNAKKVDFTPGFNVDALVAKAAFKGAWKFTTGTGAVLAIHKPAYATIPREFDVDILIDHEALRGMYIVTGVTTCPSYALYLAAREDKTISLALCAQPPLAASPLSGGPDLSMSWQSEYGGGIYRDGNKDQNCFTVLFELKVCKEKKRQGWFRDLPASDLQGLDRLEDASPPWKPLDEEGDEDPNCDFQEFEDEV